MTKEISEDDVVAFLERHPEFFQHRDRLLLKLQLPHGKKGTVSLIEKQLTLLREKHQNANKKLNTLVSLAERNEEILNKCRGLTLNLIAADNPEDFLAAMAESFTRDFQCQAYSLIIFDDAVPPTDLPETTLSDFVIRVPTETAEQQVASLLKASSPVLGPLRPAERDFLFRKQGEQIKSAVVLPVVTANDREGGAVMHAANPSDKKGAKQRRQIAVLAIGSEDSNYFNADMDTNFLGLVADTLGRLIPKHLFTR